MKNVKTVTGKIPDSVGFTATSGVIRELSKKELAQQKRNLKQLSKTKN